MAGIQPLRAGLRFTPLRRAGQGATPGKARAGWQRSFPSINKFIFKRATSPPPRSARQGGGGTTLQNFTGGRYAAALAARYGPSLDVYGPVWAGFQPVKGQEAFGPLSPVQ